MDRFADCLTWLTGPSIEGGYSDHKSDKGGATNRGVTQRTYDAWRAEHGLPSAPVSGIWADEVDAIYRDLFWNPCRCDKLPDPLDLLVFDSAVQHSPRRAVMWLQRVAGVTQDGACGPKTIAAVRALADAIKTPHMVEEYLAIREAFYAQIIANDPTQAVFRRGWVNRMKSLNKEVM